MSKPANKTAAAPAAPSTDQAAAVEQTERVSYTSDYPAIRYGHAPNGPIEFTDGQYTTDDPSEIAYLDAVSTARRA